MPARVALVKRPRDRTFGLLLDLMVWLRGALASALARRAGLEADAVGVDEAPFGPAPTWPVLAEAVVGGAADAVDACSGCDACIEVCPSESLGWLAPGQRAAIPRSKAEGAHLALAPWRCIGCEACVRACPDQLLVATSVVPSAWAPRRASDDWVDLVDVAASTS